MAVNNNEKTYGNRFPETFNSGSSDSTVNTRLTLLEKKTIHDDVLGIRSTNFIKQGITTQTTINDSLSNRMTDVESELNSNILLKIINLSEIGTLSTQYVNDEIQELSQAVVNNNTLITADNLGINLSIAEDDIDTLQQEIIDVNIRIDNIDGGGTTVNAVNVTDSVQGKTQQIINNETLALTAQLEVDVQDNTDAIINVDDKAITNTANIDALTITVENLTYVRIFNDLAAGNTMDCTAFSDFGKECGTNQQFNLSNILYGRDYTILLTGGSLHSTPFIGQTIKWEGQDASIYDANKLNKISFYKSSPFGSTQSQLFGVFSQITIL